MFPNQQFPAENFISSLCMNKQKHNISNWKSYNQVNAITKQSGKIRWFSEYLPTTEYTDRSYADESCKKLIFTTLDTIKKIDDYENIYSVNPLYSRIDHASGYIKEKNGNKYLIFDSTDEDREVLKKYSDVWNGIKNKIKELSGSEYDYEKDYMKIKCNSDDNLPLKKPLKFHNTTIIITCVFKEVGKFYPQLFLDDSLYELNV